MNNKERKELAELSMKFFKKKIKAENDLLEKVLASYLGRPTTQEDYKNCVKIMDTDNSAFKYVLAYKNNLLGLVQHVDDKVYFNPEITSFEA